MDFKKEIKVGNTLKLKYILLLKKLKCCFLTTDSTYLYMLITEIAADIYIKKNLKRKNNSLRYIYIY